MSLDLKNLFEPKSAVLVGASDLDCEEKVYSTLFHFLIQNFSNFKMGKIYIVDLSGKIEKSVKHIGSIRAGQDLAIVLLPKKMLAKHLQKLLTRKVKSLVLIEAKMDDEQIAELSNVAKRKKIALIGPDSIGVINTANNLMAVPERVQISTGHVAVVSQDSCVAYNILDLARTTGISKMVSINDTIGTDESDVLSHFSKDTETKVICVYVKKVRDGRKFVKTIREIVAEKPVIVLSGSAERSEIFEAAIKQAGALLTHDVQEMLNGAAGLARQPPLFGERVAVITNLAGQAELFERYLLEWDLSLARPSENVVEKIRKKYPNAETVGSINLGPAAKANAYKSVVEMLLSDANVDGVMMINSMKSTLFNLEDLRGIADVAKKSNKKPVVDAVLCAEHDTNTKEIMTNTDLPIYNQLEEAVHVLGILRSRGKQLEKLQKK
ncbi:MAG: hypothetical protein ABH852_01720 [Methanobacteriota archaeon]